MISKAGRLAGLSGVFTRLHSNIDKAGMREMSTQLDFKEYGSLVWPIRFVKQDNDVYSSFPYYPP